MTNESSPGTVWDFWLGAPECTCMQPDYTLINYSYSRTGGRKGWQITMQAGCTGEYVDGELKMEQ